MYMDNNSSQQIQGIGKAAPKLSKMKKIGQSGV